MSAARPAPKSVLFVCGHNIVRSPMAAALAEHLFGHLLVVASAGVRKAEPDPFVTTVMQEIGLDLSRHKPVTLEELEEYEDPDVELVVTLSPEAQHAAVELTRTRPVEVEYWPTEDPTAVEGHREQRLDAYRAVRDDLMKRIKERFGPGHDPQK